MTAYRKSSHTVFLLQYHFVFTTKYRKPALRGDVAKRVRNLIREICRSNDIEIAKGHVGPDHVHLLLSVPPNLAPSKVMQAIKGKTSHHMLQDFRQLRKEFWGRHFGRADTSWCLQATSPTRSSPSTSTTKVPSPRTNSKSLIDLQATSVANQSPRL